MKPKIKKTAKTKNLQKWDARVLWRRGLPHFKALDVLYQIMLSKTSKNVFFQKWVAPFFYPELLDFSFELLEFSTFLEKMKKIKQEVTKLHFD